MHRFYRLPVEPNHQVEISNKAQSILGPYTHLETEICFNIQTTTEPTTNSLNIISWLLQETYLQNSFQNKSFLDHSKTENDLLFEIGPLLNFCTAWCSNSLSILKTCGVHEVDRIERSRRILLRFDQRPPQDKIASFLSSIHDPMTECVYDHPLTTFKNEIEPKAWYSVPVLEKGPEALIELNKEMGLAWDDWDISFYTEMFKKLGRNPTSVECFDVSQSNSEHSRHWFFKGRIIIDGEEMPQNLFQMVQDTLHANPSNTIIAFSDNSSAIHGFSIKILEASSVVKASPLVPVDVSMDVLFTAETHNFPTGVAPFPGAETGTGGRIRDTHATGKGSLVVAGTTGYSVGNLNIPGYTLPWENQNEKSPTSLASPLEIEISASNGASDYGNKFGEPVISGFTRSFGLRLPNGERREYLKPIMFTGGIGQLHREHIRKEVPDVGMVVVKLGGPAFRVGVGGGAASSMIQGSNCEFRDFAAVQRGDAQIEQKTNRVIRACIEMGDKNPIISIHDQGAGGNANVLKEIVNPSGALIELRGILVGDSSLSVVEIWTAEYQESDALLIRQKDKELFSSICQREGAPYAYVGIVTGDGFIRLHDTEDDSTPVDLNLEQVLGKVPSKVFETNRIEPVLKALEIPLGLSIDDALDRVLRLLSVGSKRFLTSKVDRSVTGLIAQQQCVGPLHIPLSDYAIIAQSHLGLTGAVTSIGEQPIKGLICPAAMARMTVGESLTNIMFAKLSGGLSNIKASGNWMWAAKQPGEAANIYSACAALKDVLITLGFAIDGGKDSVSMATQVDSEVVKAPGTLVLSLYSTMNDIQLKVTPDFRFPGSSRIFFLDFSFGTKKNRLGGSALAQVFSQIGTEVPDMEFPRKFKESWECVQTLVSERIISAGHDRSDGGLITTLLEMSFSGNCGFDIDLSCLINEIQGKPSKEAIIAILFAEELGAVIEVETQNIEKLIPTLKKFNVSYHDIGTTLKQDKINISLTQNVVFTSTMSSLRDIWEATSFELDRLQCNPKCVDQEQKGLKTRINPTYFISFQEEDFTIPKELLENQPKVAIIREEGSNGDREMAAAFYIAGFEPWDVKISDISSGDTSLDMFCGVVFVGGFSYADVMDSAKGWSGAIRFNPKLLQEFTNFYTRPNTFSLGVCNGCQLMALLGWIPSFGLELKDQPRFVFNESGRFESRWCSVKIEESPSIMLKGMKDSILGIWVSHGEGNAIFPNKKILSTVLEKNLAPFRYVDDYGEITTSYPFNPNGSVEGIGGLCSEDGRHLALMPHPERSILNWQWPWMSPEFHSSRKSLTSPWIKIFQNAKNWVTEK